MARKPRFYLAGVPAHVMQRGNNRSAVFFDDEDYLEYLRLLRSVAQHCGTKIHAYVLMTNHVHLLLTPAARDSISRLFQGVGRLYVRYVNKKYGLTGTLWEGRHKGCSIETTAYFLSCMRYIELNPVRANMCRSPVEYSWSSYAANALGEPNAILSAHVEYLQLGRSEQARQKNYRNLFIGQEDARDLTALRNGLQTGTPVGNKKFILEIEMKLQLKVGFAQRGRPLKLEV